MDHVDERAVDPLTLRVFVGDDGTFELYEDVGEGTGYRDGEFARTTVTYVEDDGAMTLTVGPVDGDFPGRPTERGYRIECIDIGRPDQVSVGGAALSEADVCEGDRNRDDREEWLYDSDDRTPIVTLDARATDNAVVVTATFD